MTDIMKESLLEAVDCGDGEQKEETFEFNDGIGKHYQGRVIAVNETSKMNVSYAVYYLKFELGEKETEHWVFKCWSSVVPIGWQRKKKVQMLSDDQKRSLSEWGRYKLHEKVVKEYPEKKTLDD